VNARIIIIQDKIADNNPLHRANSSKQREFQKISGILRTSAATMIQTSAGTRSGADGETAPIPEISLIGEENAVI
jgi:hypothetical protein